MSDTRTPSPSAQAAADTKTRSNLARWVAFGGMSCITALGLAAILKDGAKAQEILTMLLPVIGTWVGTVLAFYFAKDNLLAATQSTKELLGLDERLHQIPAEKAMIRLDDPKTLKKKLAAGDDPNNLLLADLAKLMRDKGRNRLPVLAADGSPLFIIHLSTLTDFIAQQATADPPPADLSQLKISDLKTKSATSYDAILKLVIIKRAATLAEAKTVMEAKPGCSDVFVTENGRDKEPAIGWLTNVEIAWRSDARDAGKS